MLQGPGPDTTPATTPGGGGGEASDALRFLATSIQEAAELELDELDLMRWVGERLCRFLGDAIILLASYHDDARVFRLEALIGGADVMPAVARNLPRNPVGMTFAVNPAYLSAGRPVLRTLPGGIHELSLGQLDAAACRALEQELGVTEVRSIHLVRGARAYGSVGIGLRHGLTLDDPTAVETFVNLASVTLQRRRAEDEVLRASRRDRALLERVMDMSPVGIVVLDRVGATLYRNNHVEAILGVRRDSTSQFSSRQLIDLRDGAGVPLPPERYPSRMVLASRTAHMDQRLQLWRPDGRRVHLNVSAAPLLGADGEVEQVVMAFVDVTRDVEVERALRSSEERLRTVLQDQTDLVCRYRADGVLTFVNDAFCRYFDRTEGELLGRSFPDLLHPDDRAGWWTHVQNLAPTHPVATSEHRLGVAAEPRWHQWTDRAIFDREGKPVEYQSVGRDTTERRSYMEALAYAATHDPLTGLPNRVLLSDRLDKAMARCARSGRLAAVMMLDLDGFKDINDSRGHAAGDELLRQVAARLLTILRKSDSVARVGGDEFAVLAPDLEGLPDKNTATRRVLSAFDRPFVLDGSPVVISASVGVAWFPRDGSEPDSLLRKADQAMYDVKRSGGGAARDFQPA